MSRHSVVEAKNNLSDLINRALKGEEVVITRHGAPVVALKAVETPEPKPMTQADLDWLASVRVTPKPGPSSVEIISKMRDEDDERLRRR
jgi:prevent-host-death family protein